MTTTTTKDCRFTTRTGAQILFLVQTAAAFDRRGHGRSGQASAHNDMNGYAGDLIAGFQWSHGKQGRREVPN